MKNNYVVVKRIIDVAIATIGFSCILPVLIIIYVSILLAYGRPVIFKQKRPGYLGNIFTLYKFRTMYEIRDSSNKLLPDNYRLTTFGKFLRGLSLDELPELWNVIKGEMSLVGPRPLLVEYLDRYTQEQARRHEVKPGLTGWTQVNGRNAISWEEKFKFDVWYVNNLSFWLDLKIIIMTIIKVIKMEGIAAKGHVTMPEFQGSKR